MNWKDYIVSDPVVLRGRPVVRGTRLAVDFVLDLFVEGWTREQVLENYPRLSAEAIQAVFAYSSAHLKDEETIIFSYGTSG